MSYYPETDRHVANKVRVVLVVLLKELNDPTSVDTFRLAAKRDFIASKAEVDKLDIDKLVLIPTGLNNLKTKRDDLDVDKLKIVPVDFKTLSDVVVKNRNFTKRNMTTNNSEKKNS